MKLYLIYFSKDGETLGETLKTRLVATHDIHLFCGYGEDKIKLSDFCQKSFEEAEGIVFLSATGIAVRGIAPFVQSKVSDPAVLVIDDTGKFVISLLSGHLGKANPLTHELAQCLDSIPVITTATDNRHLFAVDSFAKAQGFSLVHPEQIKLVSSTLLRGETIHIFPSDYPVILGKQMTLTDSMEQAHVVISSKEEKVLTLIPPTFYLGMGCRKNTASQTLRDFAETQLNALGISPLALVALCSVTVKEEEEALVSLAKGWHIPFQVFAPQVLQAQEGEFTASDFVLSQIGTDNVCERSVIACGGDEIVLKKVAKDGMTLAIGRKKRTIDLR